MNRNILQYVLIKKIYVTGDLKYSVGECAMSMICSTIYKTIELE